MTEFDEAVREAKRAFEEKVYALRLAKDPAFRASADAIKAKIERGERHEGEMTHAEFAAFRAGRS